MKKIDSPPTQGGRKKHLRGRLIAAFVCVALFLMSAKLLYREMSRHEQARNAAFSIQALGGRLFWNPKTEIIETLVRDKALSRITDVHFTNPSFADENWMVLKQIPQRFGLQVEGLQFTDASLACLKDIELLDYLVLHGTGVTDEGVENLIKALPHITVMYGYPGEPGSRELNVRNIESSSHSKGATEQGEMRVCQDRSDAAPEASSVNRE